MKRKVAYKLWIKDINKSEQIFDGGKFIGINFNGKIVQRVNIVGNVIDKFDGNFTTITIDDSTGILEIRDFENKLKNIEIGDVIMVIGKLKNFNERIYILNEIVKKVNPLFLLARKIELEKIFKNKNIEEETKNINECEKIKYEVLKKIKEIESENNEVNIEELYLNLNYNIEDIKKIINALLEEGKIYEPRPGILKSF